MSATPGFFDYWGKARPESEGSRFHRLAYHCLDVAAVGQALLREDRALAQRLATCSGLQPESLSRLLPFALAVHDLGKFSLRFQCLRPDLLRDLQGSFPGDRGYKTRHDAMGLALWCDHLALAGMLPRWLRAGGMPDLNPRYLAALVEPWIRAVTGHHGQPGIERGTVAEHFPAAERARRDAVEFVDELAKLFGPIELRFARPLAGDDVEQVLKHSSWTVAGTAVLCDWVGSNTAWFPYREEPIPLDGYWPEARDNAAKALKECGILPRRPSPATGIGRLFPKVRAPRPMQQAVEVVELARGPQLFVLEDLTGSGKTEAAVVLAHRLMAQGSGGGIFFALPTMATANAMYERICEVVPRLYESGEEPSVVLAHSAPHLLGLRNIELPAQPCDDRYQGEDPSISAQCSAWIADSRKRALLAHVGVGTVDQALLAAMQVRHGTLRLMGVNRNVLVVDEVHAYDAYMTEHLARLLEAQATLGGSAILLSATLPTEQRQKLAGAFQRGLGVDRSSTPSAAYPLLTQVDASGVREIEVASAPESRRKVAVRFLDSVEAATDFVSAAAKAGRCVCWIRNTVVDAIEGHELLQRRLQSAELRLFHARFAMGDRLDIEREVLARFGKGKEDLPRPGLALVATQVVEQSLDLDFDELVTDLAPMDLVIQRAGRLHRHARKGRGTPVLHVLAPPFKETPEGNWFSKMFPRACHVYPHWGQVWLTARELSGRSELDLPDQARSLMDSVFSKAAREDVPEALQKASKDAEMKRKVSRSIAQGMEIDLPGGYGGADRLWDTDARAPTRLGEPTSTVRLVKLVNGKPKPWYESPKFAWDLSQVQLVRRRIAGTAAEDEAIAAEIQKTMPFVDEGTVTVVLRQAESEWAGHALDNDGRRVRVIYDATIGLRVEKEG